MNERLYFHALGTMPQGKIAWSAPIADMFA
jgi:hypothetical protein